VNFTITDHAHRSLHAHHRLLQALLAAGLLTAAAARAAPEAEALGSAPGSADLTRLSLSELANLDVTSVSKASEALQRAPATIYVITHEDIVRSGVTSVIEALRLAPNLLLQQQNSSSYTISARGLAGDGPAQNFSNKLLILIDGRSLYTPLYSGIYANTIDVMLEDVERIEVISGVGATLWGANAMNGVINIITRASHLTQGGFLDAGAGNSTQFGDVRAGGRMSEDITARAYALGFHRGSELMPDGATAQDGWNKGQAGFRADWSTDRDTITLQGDYYHGAEEVLQNSDSLVQGGNLLARYEHRGDATNVQVQLYEDQTEQFGPGENSTGFVVHTYDLSLQESLQAGASHRLVWGGGERLYAYGIRDSASLIWVPPSRNLTLANLFGQDTFTVTPGVNLTYGLKIEDDPYSGWSPLPDVRLSYALSDRETLWAAASRAIRSPTPFDEDIVERFGGFTALMGTGRFKPEEEVGYEFGYRSQPSRAFSLSVASFYNVYDNLRTVGPSPISGFFPLYFGNDLRGETYGVDAWGNWQVNEVWRVSPGLTWVRERLNFKPGTPQLVGTVQAGDDPSVHASLTSSLDLPRHITFDAALRYMGALPDPSMPHYYQIDARLGWQVNSDLGLSVNGQNLLHERHTEVPPGQAGGEEILRGVLAEVRWKF